MKKWHIKAVIGVILCVLAMLPALFLLILRLGWPPVLGNLSAARAITQYAAQVYPEYRAEGPWAGFNLVDGYYWLRVSGEGGTRSLGCDLEERLIWDRERAAALEEELNVGRALRSLGVLEPKGYTDWSAQWPADAPDRPWVMVRTDFYLDAPVPEEQTLRMALADRAMEVYTVMAAVTPIRRFSVACGIREERETAWYRITVELEDGKALAREDILNSKLVKS